jgi:hypothetical protein
MSVDVDIEPEWPDVQVYLGDDPDGLEIIDRVTKALDRAGHPLAADAFAEVAYCTSDLMTLARFSVTVVL